MIARLVRALVRFALAVVAVGAARVAAWARARLHGRPDVPDRPSRRGAAHVERSTRVALCTLDDATPDDSLIDEESLIDEAVRQRGSWFPGDAL